MFGVGFFGETCYPLAGTSWLEVYGLPRRTLEWVWLIRRWRWDSGRCTVGDFSPAAGLPASALLQPDASCQAGADGRSLSKIHFEVDPPEPVLDSSVTSGR